jgi:hypothetical protein
MFNSQGEDFMMKQTRWTRWMLGIVALMVLALGTAAVYPQVSEAAPITGALAFPGRGGPDGDHDELLAEALGISVEELQAAQEEAAAAAVEQAVAEGLITQEQADRLQERGLGRFPGLGRIGGDSAIDLQALLAEALGISVEELQAAQESVRATVLAQAVEDGRITQEQADLMQAREAIQSYLAERMQSAYADAVQQALDDGAITQEQADALLSNQPSFMGRNGFGGHGGFHGRGGRGDFPGNFPGDFRSQPDGSTSQSNSGRIVPASNL